MSTVYGPPPETAYVLGKPFRMPTESGGEWAVSFTTSDSQYLSAAISVAFTMIFPWVWGLFAAAVLYYAPKELTRVQAMALVTLCNSPDPWSAFKGLYAFTSATITMKRSRYQNMLLGLVPGAIAISIYIAGIVMGILGPPLLQLGNVAPARASILYYPRTPSGNDQLNINLFNGQRSPGILRALSSVEVSKATMRSKVQIYPASRLGTYTYAGGQNDSKDLGFGMNYTYSITGTDLGLQQASALELNVTGACRAEYAWVNTTAPDRDVYDFWNNPDQGGSVSLQPDRIRNLPRARFVLHENARRQLFKDGNVSYAVYVSTSHRPSTAAGSDPWYATEQAPPLSDGQQRDDAFRIRRGRPALDCWQKDTWSYENAPVKTVYDLKYVPGIPVPSVLLDMLEGIFAFPVIQYIGFSAAGPLALDSVLTGSAAASDTGLLDAGAASIQRDLERLIVASAVYSQNVLVDTTLFEPAGRPKSLGNIFTGGDGQARPGADQFVVSSPDVQTFSLRGLIALGVLVAFILICKFALALKLITHADPHYPEGTGTPDRWALFKVLTANNLLRNVYHNHDGHHNRWKCCEEFPDPDDNTPFVLDPCKVGACSCGGHIVTSRLIVQGDEVSMRRRDSIWSN
ncbi:hypothetical protein B0T16DRAFT_327263 [Cercophora newfieldiana]|uniref:Uncharacterized protein n=1 Tax=Cercophora newfieldiana TaxID=92897 RepID=A0AA39YB13_9PEZI|nr:hypothetical protein B0T16DRAFT_327263 [Cercophora newfieldiana]